MRGTTAGCLVPYTNFLNDFPGRGYGCPGSEAVPSVHDPDLDTSFSANPWGNYTYEALQIQVTKRYGSGLTVLSNYTWSKNLTDADSDYAPQEAWNGGVGGMFDPYDPKKEKTYSEFDQPQQFKIAYTYELPVGKGKKWLGNANRLTDTAVGGWTLGGVDSYSTGFPLFVQENNWTAGTFAGQATGGNARPNVVQGANPKAILEEREGMSLDRPPGSTLPPSPRRRTILLETLLKRWGMCATSTTRKRTCKLPSDSI